MPGAYMASSLLSYFCLSANYGIRLSLTFTPLIPLITTSADCPTVSVHQSLLFQPLWALQPGGPVTMHASGSS